MRAWRLACGALGGASDFGFVAGGGASCPERKLKSRRPVSSRFPTPGDRPKRPRLWKAELESKLMTNENLEIIRRSMDEINAFALEAMTLSRVSRDYLFAEVQNTAATFEAPASCQVMIKQTLEDAEVMMGLAEDLLRRIKDRAEAAEVAEAKLRAA